MGRLEIESRKRIRRANIQKLVQHKLFDIKNPNKIYSVLDTLGTNLSALHDKTGNGYRFYADMILKIDANNPSLASIICKNISNFQRYCEPYASLMRTELERMQASNISKNLREVVTKSLESNKTNQLDQPFTAITKTAETFFSTTKHYISDQAKQLAEKLNAVMHLTNK